MATEDQGQGQDQNQIEEEGYIDGDLEFNSEYKTGYTEMNSHDLFEERFLLDKKGQMVKIMAIPKEV